MSVAMVKAITEEDTLENVSMPAYEALRLAVSRKDSADFNEQYFLFLQQFAEFRNSLAAPDMPDDDSFVPYNPTFGVRASFTLIGSNSAETVSARARKQTSALLANGRIAHNIFARLPLKDRLECLAILEKTIRQHQDDIALTISADTGKPIANAASEMDKGSKWFADAYEKSWAQLGESRNGKKTKSLEPLGVVQVISAYNYPYALAIGGIVGALATGNSVIITPSNKAPNWIFPFIRAAKAALAEFAVSRHGMSTTQKNTLKDYLIQYSIGVNTHLTDEVDLVHFVGSNAVGEAISTSRMKKHKKTILELGGNSAVVVMESALAIADNKGAEGIAKKIFEGFAPATGQRCTAPRLIFLQGNTNAVASTLALLCRTETQQHTLTGTPCNPFEKHAAMGPLVDDNARMRMEQAIKLAGELGAVVNGGSAEETSLAVDNNIIPGGSCWVNPVAIDWTHIDTTQLNLSQQEKLNDLLTNETFGPLVHIVKKINTIQDAVDEVNLWDKYKLAAAVFTGNPEDTQIFQQATGITSVVENSGPKDQSPQGPHGHPWLDPIGGESHYLLYTRQFTIKSNDGLQRINTQEDMAFA